LSDKSVRHSLTKARKEFAEEEEWTQDTQAMPDRIISLPKPLSVRWTARPEPASFDYDELTLAGAREQSHCRRADPRAYFGEPFPALIAAIGCVDSQLKHRSAGSGEEL
jgi:hypothetical protein